MKPVARWAVATVILSSAVLWLGNGRDPWLWAYAFVFAATGLYAMLSMSEELARERFTPPSPGADRLSLRIVRLVALAHLIAGVADSRYGWTEVPAAMRGIGLAGFTLCFLAVVHAARANRFFSSVVRIQTERGHQVVETGPYAIVRHPGYAAMLPLAQFSALALGSWVAFAVAFAYSALILKRVRFEDRFLQQNLDGYAGYAERVPFRLIPYVW